MRSILWFVVPAALAVAASGKNITFFFSESLDTSVAPVEWTSQFNPTVECAEGYLPKLMLWADLYNTAYSNLWNVNVLDGRLERSGCYVPGDLLLQNPSSFGGAVHRWDNSSDFTGDFTGETFSLSAAQPASTGLVYDPTAPAEGGIVEYAGSTAHVLYPLGEVSVWACCPIQTSIKFTISDITAEQFEDLHVRMGFGDPPIDFPLPPDQPYAVSDLADFTIIPEPSAAALFALAGLLLRRR